MPQTGFRHPHYRPISSMRILPALLASLSLAAPVWAETSRPVAGPAQLAKVGFVQEIAAAGAKKLLGQSGNRFFLAKPDGTVKVISADGKDEAVVLGGKGRKGEAILKRPEAVVAAGDNVYVVDSELNRIVMFAADGKYKGSFGSKGSGRGELHAPQGIAFNDGILYVADTGNGRIQLFGDNGVFLNTLEINSEAKDKKLFKPVAVAVDPAGRMVYVLDAGDSLFSDDFTIKIYGPDGAFLRQLPKNGKQSALTAVPDGLYVADQQNFAVQKYDLGGKLVSSFGSKGDGRAQFRSLDGLTAEKGQVYVGDSARGAILNFRADSSSLPAAPEPRQTVRVSVRWTESVTATASHLAWAKDVLYGISANGSVLRIRNGAIDGEIRAKAKDITPVAVAADKSGGLWILDKKKTQVVKLDDAGNPLVTIGSSGSGNGQFDEPSDLVISGEGIIFVADTGNHRIQAFSDDGVFLSAIKDSASGGPLRRPSAVALDPQGNLYVLDTERSIVAVYSPKGDPIRVFGKGKSDDPASFHDARGLMATQDEVFVAEPDQVKVYAHDGKYLRAFGAPGAENGQFGEIIAIAARDSTTFSVAERDNKRVQSLTTLYKPAPPAQTAAQGVAHTVLVQWAPSSLPYVAQYEVYRSKSDSDAFVRIGTSKTNQFSDDGLPPDEKYYYRVSAESAAGFEGLAGQTVNAVSQKYSPPQPEDIKVAATISQLKMSWKPLDSRYISAYLIYRKDGDAYTKIGETVAPEFIKDGLTAGTDYVFYLSARSVDGIESGKAPIRGTTIADTSMPLDVNVVELRDVFSNTYKLYEQEGVGKARLTNNTTSAQKNVKLSFVLNNFMDYPTETTIDTLAPGESKDVPLKAVFNNNILSLTEDTPVQVKVEASYYVNGKKKVFSSIKTINIYDKHRLMWNEPGRYAAFITPKDPVPLNFTRSVASEFPAAKDAPQLAAAVFDSLGVLGVTYAQDPINPYQATSGKTDTVDYVQYPRETLQRKAGDCDDLTALYTSALEGLGIPTRVILVPEHMLMMFSTGVNADEDGYTMDDMYVIHEGTLWIPVETTLLGKSFSKAWESGAKAYYKWKDKDLTILDPQAAWGKFKPASLPDDSWKPADITPAALEQAFPGDLMSTLKISSQTKTRRYMEAIRKDPSNMNAHLQVGIILAKAGDRAEALKYFRKIVDKHPNHAAALNNEGNLYMLDGQYQSAQKAYFEASKADPQDAETLVNLTKAYKAGNDVGKAKETFAHAQRLDPSLAERYKTLALELSSTMTPERRKPSRRPSK